MPSVNQKGIAHILLLILLVAGIGLGIYLVQNRTNIFPQASISSPIAPKTGFTLTASNNTVSPGSEFYVKVTANSDFDAANLFTLIMNYPADKVQVLEIFPSLDDAPSMTDTFIKKWIEQTDDKNGKIILSGAIPNPGFKTNAGSPGFMAGIRFKVLADNGGIPLAVSGDSGIYRNSDNQNIMGTNVGVTVKVGVGPKPSCKPRPECLDANPRCNIPVTSDMCPPAPSPLPEGRCKTNSDCKTGQSCQPAVCPMPYFCGPNSTDSDFVKCQEWQKTSPCLGYCINSSPKPSCKPRPVCLDATPRCLIPVSSDMCPPSPSPSPSCRVCPIPAMKPGCDLKIIDACNCQYQMVCASPSPSPLPPKVDGKRADLYKDSKKPNFINDQDISVFFSKCAEKGVELFGQPASVRPVCDIFEDGKITVQDWAVLIKFRNQQI